MKVLGNPCINHFIPFQFFQDNQFSIKFMDTIEHDSQVS